MKAEHLKYMVGLWMKRCIMKIKQKLHMARKHNNKIIRIKRNIMLYTLAKPCLPTLKFLVNKSKSLKEEKQQQARDSSYKDYISFFNLNPKSL